jgi:integrase
LQYWEVLRRAILEVERRHIARLKGNYQHHSFDHLFAPASSPNNSGQTPMILLAELIQQYLADYHKTKSVGGKRRHKLSAAFELVQRFFGRDTFVHQIDRKRCREFRNLLNLLPSNLRQHFPKANQSLEDIAAEAAKRKLPVMARDTQETYLSALKQLLEWAEKEGHVARNEAATLTPLGQKVDAREARDPFTIDQLARIFNAPLYRGCKDDTDGYAVPGRKVIRGTRFWITLLGLYTGMRLNEICQLDLSDIQKSKVGTWFISVNANTPDKAVKNNLSKRSIPIHPDLVRIGFLKFVETQSGKSKLFPDLKRSGRGYYSERMTRWFNEGFLPKIGVKTDKTSFHSFRHCFRDALRAIDAPPAVVQGLGGWRTEQGVSSQYGSGLPIDQLVPWVERIRYDGLDLSHLNLR